MDQLEQQQLINNQFQAVRRAEQSTKWIWVTFQRSGFHYYAAAGTDPNLADVSYLANRHRHLFKFRVKIRVFHDDRELEFHQVLNYCENLFNDQHIELNHKSVEMLADELFRHLAVKYPQRAMVISVAEDGECGCEVEYPYPI